MDMAKQPATIDCDFIAPFYQPVEHLCFGDALDRRRTAFLPFLHDAQQAISCGEGDGRFMAAFLGSNPRVQVTAVDVSCRMLEIARRRVGQMGDGFQQRAQYFCTELTAFQPQANFDLIATHFFLDCFSTSELQDVVQRIAGWAAPGARWVVSEFHQPSHGLAHLWTGAVVRSLYAAFRVTTGLRVTRLPHWHPALVAAGLELQRQEYACGGLLVSELWQRR